MPPVTASTGWTADTLKVYVDQRFDDMNARISQALKANQEAVEKVDQEVTRRFDGMDQNFDRLFKTVNERGGGMNLLKQVIPSVIAIGSIIAVIVVGTGH
jgi:hypothetical protein